MQNRFELPMMMSAKELQDMGFSRSLAYKLLQGDIIPVIAVGKRRFVRQSVLLGWLAEQEQKCPAGRKTGKIETSDPFPAGDDELTFEDQCKEYEGGDEI